MSNPKSDRTLVINSQVTQIGHDAPVAAAPPIIPDVVIESELGRGGMGVVYKGRQGYINRPVAVKLLLHAGGAADGEYVKRFQREATLLAGLNHPHIVACYQAGVTADRHCYLVMEYLDGPNLWQYVRKHGPLAEADALGVVKAIAAALEYANSKGVIHRDVKAENILLAPSGGGGSFPYIAKLVDLGLARPVQPAGDMSLTRQGMLLGTPATMAPEQFDDPESVDHRADIYGLGCALYQSVTGKPAFAGNSLAQIVADKVNGDIPDPRKSRGGLSPGTSEIVAWMLAKKREERPQTYAELIARVERVITGGVEPRKRSLAPLLIGLVAVLALVVAAVARFTGGVSTAPAPSPLPPVVEPAPVAAAPPVSVQPPSTLPKPVSFAAPQALYGADLRTALDGWTTVPGWGLADDSLDLIGHSDSTARITRPIEKSPWRIAGMITIPTGRGPFREAGLRIELGDGSALAVTIKDLGTKRYAALTVIASDGMADQRELKLLPDGEVWPIELTCQGGNFRAMVADVTFNPLRLTAESAALSLTVTKGAVGIRGLTLAAAQ